jgi:hypothetical protein
MRNHRHIPVYFVPVLFFSIPRLLNRTAHKRERERNLEERMAQFDGYILHLVRLVVVFLLALSPLYDPIALKFVRSFSSPTVLALLASFKVVRFHHHGSIHLAPVGFPFSFLTRVGGGDCQVDT